MRPPLLCFLTAAVLSLGAAGAGPLHAADAPMKRVLILGDSISIGYTPFVKELLQGQAEVVRPEGNCEGTTRGVKELDRWLGDGHWDAIHSNFGLHDLKRVHAGTGEASNDPADPRQADPDAYERQLREIVVRLKKSGAKLIFATTTPVPEGKVSPHRDPADVVSYNRIAVRVMRDQGVAVDDLYAFAAPRLKGIQLPANVHFKPEGYRGLAGQVAASLREALQLPKPAEGVGK